MLAIWSLVPLPFLNHWTSGSSQFTYCWSLAWRILSITLLACEMSAIVWYCEHSLALPFFGIGMKTDLFQSCGHCWVFHICWHIECSTFTASSFRIWMCVSRSYILGEMVEVKIKSLLWNRGPSQLCRSNVKDRLLISLRHHSEKLKGISLWWVLLLLEGFYTRKLLGRLYHFRC